MHNAVFIGDVHGDGIKPGLRLSRFLQNIATPTSDGNLSASLGQGTGDRQSNSGTATSNQSMSVGKK
jgi:hypothetical protein